MRKSGNSLCISHVIVNADPSVECRGILCSIYLTYPFACTVNCWTLFYLGRWTGAPQSVAWPCRDNIPRVSATSRAYLLSTKRTIATHIRSVRSRNIYTCALSRRQYILHRNFFFNNKNLLHSYFFLLRCYVVCIKIFFNYLTPFFLLLLLLLSLDWWIAWFVQNSESTKRRNASYAECLFAQWQVQR